MAGVTGGESWKADVCKAGVVLLDAALGLRQIYRDQDSQYPPSSRPSEVSTVTLALPTSTFPPAVPPHCARCRLLAWSGLATIIPHNGMAPRQYLWLQPDRIEIGQRVVLVT